MLIIRNVEMLKCQHLQITCSSVYNKNKSMNELTNTAEMKTSNIVHPQNFQGRKWGINGLVTK